MKLDYKSAGVNVAAGYDAVVRIKRHAAKTFNDNVVSDIGGFGGMFSIKSAKDMDDPVLVSGTDSVGTKVMIAFLMDKHDTVGIDCVAMCVNDIICSGARPLYFLDYIACGKNYPDKIEELIKGVVKGCQQADAALIGGEVAEMPGVYDENEYDIAGFAVCIVDKAKIIDGSAIKAGDALVGIASDGLHSNGFSLVRKVLRPSKGSLNEHIEAFRSGMGAELLKPTRIYVRPVLGLIEKIPVLGIANITGGGFYENIPRILPAGLTCRIDLGSWHVPPVFDFLVKQGVEKNEMYHTFNMGVGMVTCLRADRAVEAVSVLRELGEKAYIIGNVIEGSELVIS